MESKIIARFLLQVYLLVFAALPLSYIHIEDTQGTHCLVAAAPLQGNNIHLLLHEIFFAHFSNRSDHCSSPFSEGTLSAAEKNVPQKISFGSSSLITPGLTDACFSSALPAAVPVTVGNDIPSTIDVRSTSSGLSPPSA